MTNWSNFYVITGTAAATLTGLMFVVLTLVRGDTPSSRTGIAVFSSPTVLHFSAALLLSSLASMPWPSRAFPAIAVSVVGLCGLGYTLWVTVRGFFRISYQIDLDEWTWYAALPLLSYAATLASGILFAGASSAAPFALAAGVTLLIFIGIHNAWDIVTYVVVTRPGESEDRKAE